MTEKVNQSTANGGNDLQVLTLKSNNDMEKEKNEKETPLTYEGIPYDAILNAWWQVTNDGCEPCKMDVQTRLFELAAALRHTCNGDADMLMQIIPSYGDIADDLKRSIIGNALKEPSYGMPRLLTSALQMARVHLREEAEWEACKDDLSDLADPGEECYKQIAPAMPMGIRDTFSGITEGMRMPALAGVTSMIGALATGVRLDVHGDMKPLNLLCYVVGRAASGKGQMDGIYNLWMHHLIEQERILDEQEAAYDAEVRAAANRAKQPEERHFPHRLADEVSKASLIDLLKYSGGKHVFLFSSEADTANSNRGAWANLSAIFRKAYDSAQYNRRFKSSDTTKANLDNVLVNCLFSTTPGGLFRSLRGNVENGLATRYLVARTPDGTYDPLEVVTPRTEAEKANVLRIAAMLELMHGDLTLPRLEEQGQKWLEEVRMYCLYNGLAGVAQLRMRACVTAMRMVCGILLCAYAERLINTYHDKAEEYLRTHPFALIDELPTLDFDDIYDAFTPIADYVLDNLSHYFAAKMQAQHEAEEERKFYRMGNTTTYGPRTMRGKNDTVLDALPYEFTFEDAVYAKGNGASRNTVARMLYLWKKQKLIEVVGNQRYKKI